MRLKTRIFELYKEKYRNISELARVMGISASQLYRVRQSKRKINGAFVIGAAKAFPGYTLNDLFYIESKGG